MMQNLFGDGRV